jgi:hypothetical protein
MWVRWPTYEGLEELRPPILHPAQSGTPHSQQG